MYSAREHKRTFYSISLPDDDIRTLKDTINETLCGIMRSGCNSGYSTWSLGIKTRHSEHQRKGPCCPKRKVQGDPKGNMTQSTRYSTSIRLKRNKCFTRYLLLQILSSLVAASGALSIGASVSQTGVLIPALQREDNPELRITLEEGSWLSKL